MKLFVFALLALFAIGSSGGRWGGGNRNGPGRNNWNRPRVQWTNRFGNGGGNWKRPGNGGGNWNRPGNGGGNWNRPGNGGGNWNRPGWMNNQIDDGFDNGINDDFNNPVEAYTPGLVSEMPPSGGDITPPGSSTGGQCGQTPIEPTGDTAGIIGGDLAKPGSWPWQVSFANEDVGHYCGGSIIANQWILTASHCVVAYDDDSMVNNPQAAKVKVGAFDLTKSGTDFDIEKAYKHPKYDIYDALYRNDVALIKLKKPVTYSDTVQPICLPATDKAIVEKTNVKMTVTGWGNTMTNGDMYPNKLMQVSVRTFDFKTCQGQYHDGKINNAIQFCAGGSGKDSCSADSGGPLIRKNGDSWFEYGVVSFGGNAEKLCDNQQAKGVYARVSHFCDWIKQITGQQLCI